MFNKKEAVPLRSIEAHLGERRYSSYSFLTSALGGGEWSASRPGRPLPPDKEPPVPIVQEAGWAPEPVWTQRLEEKSSAPVGDRTPAVQSVIRHCTDWAHSQAMFRNGKAASFVPGYRKTSSVQNHFHARFMCIIPFMTLRYTRNSRSLTSCDTITPFA
jgi:hypothetical protein